MYYPSYSWFKLDDCLWLDPSGLTSEALPGFLGNGEKGIYSVRGTGEQRPNFEGNKDNIGK